MDTSFERTNQKDEWLTPPHILEALGHFDLDPCAPINRPWSMADEHYTIMDNGLMKPWHGRVWCNPPYGTETGKWLAKLAEHGNGIALIFARTETGNFFDHIWKRADAIMFIKGRLAFHDTAGIRAKNSAGAASCLIAYGQENVEILKGCALEGIVLDIPKIFKASEGLF